MRFENKKKVYEPILFDETEADNYKPIRLDITYSKASYDDNLKIRLN